MQWRDGDSFDARPLFYDALHYFVWQVCAAGMGALSMPEDSFAIDLTPPPQIVALLSLFVYRSSFVWNVATKVSHKINQVCRASRVLNLGGEGFTLFYSFLKSRNKHLYFVLGLL